jgi:hypothetical protein
MGQLLSVFLTLAGLIMLFWSWKTRPLAAISVDRDANRSGAR